MMLNKSKGYELKIMFTETDVIPNVTFPRMSILRMKFRAIRPHNLFGVQSKIRDNADKLKGMTISKEISVSEKASVPEISVF